MSQQSSPPRGQLGSREFLVGANRRHRKRNALLRCLFGCFQAIFCCGWIRALINCFRHKKEFYSRTIRIGKSMYPGQRFPSNAVRNQKYNIITFIPCVLFEQFKLFLNLYFLLIALSQFIPDLRIGYLYTYWGPLGFVLGVTIIREAIDDFLRYLRDREMNKQKYEKLVPGGSTEKVSSSRISVGDLIIIHKDQRVAADLVLMRTTEKSGTCFIRTDQLDGETDWKLRIPVGVTQQMSADEDIFQKDIEIYAEKPQKDIHSFIGTCRIVDESGVEEGPLNIENTMWANTVLASGSAVGLVIYTGTETRSVMNASQPSSKMGKLDYEVNNLTKILFLASFILSLTIVSMRGFTGQWYLHLFRFILLFSYIVPLSLRVNLDMAKIVYQWMIGRDKMIPTTVVRSSTISEELGRISYLLSDKTGTLTKNEMVFKKLHLGTVAFGSETFDEVAHHLKTVYASETKPEKQSLISKIHQAVEAITLCHNVTPLHEETGESEEVEADQQRRQKIAYQAASPDEVALVTWSESVGLTLINRDLSSMQIMTPQGEIKQYAVLQLFPFTSDSKRMGIIVQEEHSGEIVFFMKGADTVMKNIVQYNDWLDEECSNMAREGLRTLVVARKTLNKEQYMEFDKQYHAAKISLSNRAENMAAVLSRLEKNMTLLCVTGVEDSLQDGVRTSLELLKNAGIRIWMLTGDKLETAICIAKSSGLFSRTENIHVFGSVLNRLEAHAELNALRRKTGVGLVITGSSLKVCLEQYESDLAELACSCTAVVCCRCSPEQKAQIANLLIKYRAPLRIAAVGDGGNDVSMIQAAHAGIGIEAKEGKQASLAADFSITQFSYLCRLLLYHGRNCYKRSCALSQFVIHRGLIISTMQAIFSCVFYFASISIYQGPLMVGYSTFFTTLPVFSLVMDCDVTAKTAMTYPELYKELIKGRSLSYKTFFVWFLVSIYQGSVIMYGALLLFDSDFIHIVSITFTALILTELIMVGITIHTWHWLMVVSELISVAIYLGALLILHDFFDLSYILTVTFLWKTAGLTAVSCVPLFLFKVLRGRLAPPTYARVA